MQQGGGGGLGAHGSASRARLGTAGGKPAGCERSTVATLRVGTRAKARSETRIGLTFESVSLDAQTFLGVDVATLLPALSAPLLRLPGSGGADSEQSPSYFDVAFVDDAARHAFAHAQAVKLATLLQLPEHFVSVRSCACVFVCRWLSS